DGGRRPRARPGRNARARARHQRTGRVSGQARPHRAPHPAGPRPAAAERVGIIRLGRARSYGVRRAHGGHRDRGIARIDRPRQGRLSRACRRYCRPGGPRRRLAGRPRVACALRPRRARHRRAALRLPPHHSAVRESLSRGLRGRPGVSATKILAVGAHPDDIEFGCAPLLLLEAQAGAEIKLLVLSRGEAGSSGTPELREQEARAAAAMMSASFDFLDFRGDCHLEATPANAFRIAAEIRRFQPQIVLAPHPGANQHPDHVAAGTLVRNACRFARYGGLADLKALAPQKIGHLYFYDITQHGLRAPDIVVDVSSVASLWENVMRCHASQVQSKGYIDLQLTAARLLGTSIGVEYACGVYVNDPVRLGRLSELTLSARNF